MCFHEAAITTSASACQELRFGSQSILESAYLDGAGPIQRFLRISLPMITPTLFFLIVINFVYGLFETFAIVDATTRGGPAGATSILVYKVYQDGFVTLDLGSSAAQSVVLMALALVSALCLAAPVRLALKPLAIVGAMTLSGYFCHVLLEGQWGLWTVAGQTPWGAPVPTGWADLGLQVAVLFPALLLWHLLPGRLGKGPLEWLSRVVASTVVRSR